MAGRKGKIRTGKRGGKFRLHKVKRGKHKGKIVRVYTRKKRR